jgi:hypothetical protein
MVYSDFLSFMQSVVLPRHASHPDDVRLDGATTGGNWDVAGMFQHQGKTWKVHADTHYEPLEIAYQAASAGQDPFIESPMTNRMCLVLTKALHATQQSPHKYLYIYEA